MDLMFLLIQNLSDRSVLYASQSGEVTELGLEPEMEKDPILTLPVNQYIYFFFGRGQFITRIPICDG